MVKLDERYDKERKVSEIEAVALRDEMETSGEVDRYEKIQPEELPEVDESFIGARIEQLWFFKEEDGTQVPESCQGKVVAVKKGNKVHIEWEAKCLREGNPSISEE